MAVGLGAIRLPPSAIDGELPEDMQQPNGGLSPRDIDLSGDGSPIDPDTQTKVETPDGGVVVYIGKPKKKRVKSGFYDNLAEDLDDSELGGIAQDLLERIQEDDTSRKEWLETRQRGIELMGLVAEMIHNHCG